MAQIRFCEVGLTMEIRSGPTGAPSTEKIDPSKQTTPMIRPIILGDLTLASPTTQTTIGANGAASALTANPVGYVTIMIGNSPFIIPYYNI